MTVEDRVEEQPAAAALSEAEMAGLAAAQERLGAETGAERRRAPDGSRRRVNEDAVVIPLAGMTRSLSMMGALMPDHVRQRLAELSPEQLAAHADRLSADADREAFLAGEAARKANRFAAYLRNRNPKYASASYSMLRPDQLHGGKVARWWSSPRRPRSMLLAGRSRTGKTTAGYAIGNDAHASGAWVEVFTEIDLNRALRDETRATGVWARATGCDLLLLDDWGRARATDWWKEQLQELFDIRIARADSGQRLVVTANTPADQEQAYDELVDRYGDPIVERIIDGGDVLMFDGPRIRNLVQDY